MPFTVENFRDLIQLLETRPEWRLELRRLMLTDELLALPEQLALLRVRSEEQFHTLIEAQERTEAQMTALTERVTALAAAQERTEAQVATLINDVGELKGDTLEARYRTKGQTYFRRIVRRPHVLTADEITTLIEDAQDQGALSEAEADDLSEVDVMVRGRHSTDRMVAYLVVEVSWGVGVRDVERAVRRATLLAQAGVVAIPVVAGKWITPDAAQFAYSAQVWQLTEGRVIPPPSTAVSS